jgi:capsular exopolysaccharide synthesis family protein
LSNQSEASKARDFIVQQLPDSEKAVSKAEAKLRDFKEKNGVIVLEQESTTAVDAISRLDQQIMQTKGQLAQMSARVDQLMDQVKVSPRAGLTLNALNQSEGVQKALANLQETQAQLAKERARFQARHPAIDALKRQEVEARADLRARAQEVTGAALDIPTGQLQIGKTAQDQIATLAQTEVERISLDAQLRSLINAKNAYADRARKLPELEKTQRELERQLEAAQTTYKTLLTKLQEVQVAMNQAVGNAEIVATAEVPKQPVSPVLWLNLLAATALGLCLGVAIAFLLDSRDQSVRSLSDARSLFDYPLLGMIPRVSPGGDDRYSDAGLFNDSFPAQEAYQMLHTNLKFVVSDRPVKSIVVTSSVRNEGKSTVAANLAVAMAQVQRRVLLVDADFRNPCQHHVWDLINRGGLSNVLVGQLSLNDAIQTVMPKLHVLTAGSIPPNPIALLDSRRMVELVKHLRDRYDVILFDSPALGGTADATILNKLTDGSLLVVRPDVLTVQSAKTAKLFLSQSNQTVLGMVMNGVDVKQEPQGLFYQSERQPEFTPSR